MPPCEGAPASGHRRLPFAPDETFEAIGEVGEADFGSGPIQPDGTDEQAHLILLQGEDPLDAATAISKA